MSNRTIEDGSNCRNRSRNGIAMERHRKHRLSMAQGESTSCHGVTHTPRHDSTVNRSANRTLSLGTGAAAPSKWHPGAALGSILEIDIVVTWLKHGIPPPLGSSQGSDDWSATDVGLSDRLFGRAPSAEIEFGMTRPKPIWVTSRRVAMRFGRGARIRGKYRFETFVPSY